MSNAKAAPSPWQAPALSSGHVVRSSAGSEARPEHMLRWAQQRALAILAEAEAGAQQVYQEAYANGLRDGAESARAEAQRALAEEAELRRQGTVRELEEFRQEMCQDRALLARQFQEDLGRLALEIGGVLALRDLQSWHGLIWQLLDECLSDLGHPPSGTVLLGDRTQLEAVKERLPGFEVIHDPALAEWDLRVRCDGGQAEVSYAERLGEVRKAVLEHLKGSSMESFAAFPPG